MRFTRRSMEEPDERWRHPRVLSDDILGPLLSPETKQAVARAESKPQALALLLMSPEFQRR